MKCPTCGYDDHGTGDSAHHCAVTTLPAAPAPTEQAELSPLPTDAAAWVTPLRYGSKVTFPKPPKPEGWDDDEEKWYCNPLFTAAQMRRQRQEGRREGIVQGYKEIEPSRKCLSERLELAAQQLGGETWVWGGDGADNLASMGNSMAVVIRADQLRAALAARQAPTEPPKLNQQQEESITALRLWCDLDMENLKLAQRDKYGVKALLAGFDAARQAPDSGKEAVDAARWREVVRRIGWREIGKGRGCVWSADLPSPPKHGDVHDHFAALIDAAILKGKAQ